MKDFYIKKVNGRERVGYGLKDTLEIVATVQARGKDKAIEQFVPNAKKGRTRKGIQLYHDKEYTYIVSTDKYARYL